MTKRRILLVEDETSISEPLSAALGKEGFVPTIAETVADGLERFRSDRPDLVLLDVMLPDGDGKDLLRQIRAESRTPVVMLTARGQETDTVVGRGLGADGYVVKPFGAAELIARIRAVLRRSSTPDAEAPAVLRIGDVEMNLHTHSTAQGGTGLDLTLKEFELLRMLMEGA